MTRSGKGRKRKEEKRELPDGEINVAPDAQRTREDGGAQDEDVGYFAIYYKYPDGTVKAHQRAFECPVEDFLKCRYTRDVARIVKEGRRDLQHGKDGDLLFCKGEQIPIRGVRDFLDAFRGSSETSPVQILCPAPVGAVPGLSPGVSETLWQDLGEFLAAYKAKQKSKKSVCLSSVSQSIWDTLQQQEGLKMFYSEAPSNPKRLSELPAFGWDDRLEKSQADRYIVHLNTIKCGRQWKLIDAANSNPTLLSGWYGGWNFKGTTDVAFIHRSAGMLSERLGLKCIIELRKVLGVGHYSKAVNQTVIRLVMANIFAPQFKPCAVLTDLNDSWLLFWMDGSTIYWCPFESRGHAVGYIEELLEDSDGNGVGTSEALANLRGENDHLQFIKKRRMYEP